ncbi:MAG: hypothetical protein ABMA64_37185 [Myxococcota bacterium]
MNLDSTGLDPRLAPQVRAPESPLSAAVRCAVMPLAVIGTGWLAGRGWSMIEGPLGLRAGTDLIALPVVVGVGGACAIVAGWGHGASRRVAAMLGGLAAGAVPWLVDLPWSADAPATLVILPVIALTAGVACSRTSED